MTGELAPDEQVLGQQRGEILRVAQNDNEVGNSGDEETWTGTREVPPLRFASVGMTEGVAPVGTTEFTEISYEGAPVRVVVVRSDEERMIARDTVQCIERENAS
jgi:hypothetical protein